MPDQSTRPLYPTAICPNCHSPFTQTRKDKKFCSDKCRKSQHQKAVRQETPQNSKSSPSKRRTNLEFFDKALRLAEMYYTMPPFERLGFIKGLIDQARSEGGKLRQILTNQMLLNPPKERKYLFYRRHPDSHETIAQIANRYCRRFWNAGVRDVVNGVVSEPETGEVIENVFTIFIRQSADLKFLDRSTFRPTTRSDLALPSSETPMMWMRKRSSVRTEGIGRF